MTAGSDNPVTRIEHEGRVYRWQRPSSAWPGHTRFVAIRGSEVVLGDRYAREGIERSYACSLQDLLDGCFREQLVEQLGESVHREVLAEVRHELGFAADTSTERADAVDDSADAEPRSTAEPAAAPAASESSAQVSVVLTAVPSIDLPLVVALRSIGRAPVAALLPALQDPPCVLASDVPRTEGEVIARRLQPLGATVELRPPVS